MIKQCAKCNKEFNVKPSHAHLRKHCSRHCFYSSRFGEYKNPELCSHCGISFFPGEYRKAHSGKVFCTMKCYGLSKRKRVEIKCLNCGILRDRKASEHRNSVRHFCSQECCVKYFTGKTRSDVEAKSGYGAGWRKIAAQARNRDVVCRLCGKTEEENGRKLDVHHRIPFVDFGYEFRILANAENNLMSLCKSCHRWAEANPV